MCRAVKWWTIFCAVFITFAGVHCFICTASLKKMLVCTATQCSRAGDDTAVPVNKIHPLATGKAARMPPLWPTVACHRHVCRCSTLVCTGGAVETVQSAGKRESSTNERCVCELDSNHALLKLTAVLKLAEAFSEWFVPRSSL